MNTLFWISLSAVSGHLWTPIFTFRLHVSWHFSSGFTWLSYSIWMTQSMTESASCYCNESLNSTFFNKYICEHIISRARKIRSIMFRTCVMKRWEKQTKEYRSCAACVKTTHSLCTHSFSVWEQEFVNKISPAQRMSRFFFDLCMRLSWSRRKVRRRVHSAVEFS